jgi:hypothetical protein
MTPSQTRDLAVAGVLSAALAAAGTVAAFGGEWFKTEAIKREQSMRKQALEASGRLARANEEREQISAYMQRYQNYLRIKAIRPNVGAKSDQDPAQGERLDWIERIVEAREARSLPRIVYSIAARKPYEGLVAPGPGLTFYASRMKLELGLLHEGDFIDYLRRVANPPAGIFQIERCSLESLGADKGRQGKNNPGTLAKLGVTTGGKSPQLTEQANLSAICEIDWITLVEDAATGTAGGPAK